MERRDCQSAIVCRTGIEYIYILAPNYLRRGGRWKWKRERRRNGRSDGFSVRPNFSSNMTRNTILIGPRLKRNITAEFIHERVTRQGGRGGECHEKSHRIRKHETVSDTQLFYTRSDKATKHQLSDEIIVKFIE